MSEGKRLVEDMQAAGFSDEEIGSWAAQERNTMGAAGFSEAEIDTWFGRPPLDTGPIKALVNENIKAAIKPETPDGQPKPVKDFYEALDLGFQHSVSGLMKAKPENKVLDENAPMASRIASQVGTLAGDLPFMVGGALLGMGGGPIGAGGGAFGLPMGMRAILMDAYERGSSTTFSDFWDVASGAIIETAKGWITGAATMGVGGAVGKAVAPIASPTIRAGATLSAEVGTMVTVGSALEGHVPKAQDFLDAAILIGGLKGAVGVAGKLRNIYTKTGVSPDIITRDIERDPTIQADLVAENIEIPRAYQPNPVYRESVVRTPEGDLIQLYHGSKGNIVEFDAARMDRDALYGPGVYMTDNPRVASSYAEGKSISRWNDIVTDIPSLQQYYKIGDTIKGDYGLEKVVDFKAENGIWSVTVQEIYSDGRPKERPRTHSTAPYRRNVDETLESRGAEIRVGPNVQPLYANIKKPFDMEAPVSPATANTVLEKLVDLHIFSKEEAGSIKKMFEKQEGQESPVITGETFYRGLVRVLAKEGYADKGSITEALKKAGFDGITHTGGKITGGESHKVWIAFDGKQVKNSFAEPAKIKEAPIVRFTRMAKEIEPTLPPVEEGFTRLWRGNRPGEVGQNPQFTNSLNGIALPFREAYKGDLSYVDVPSSKLASFENKGVAATGAEFILPPELASQAKVVPLPGTTKIAAPVEPPTPGSIEAAQAKVLEKVVVGGTSGKRATTLSDLYEMTVDALAPVKKLQDEAGVTGFGPYEQLRLVAGAPGKADAMLKYGTFRPENPGKTTGPSFNQIVAPLKDNLDAFRSYLVSARALEIEAQGKKSGIDLNAARTVVDNAGPEMKQAARELVNFQNQVLDYVQRQGVLTPEAAAAMKDANKNYVPFFRIMDDATASGKSLKELRGSMRDIVDPLESVMKNTFAMVAMADKNAAKLSIIEMAQKLGVEKAEKIAADKGFAEFDVTAVLKESGMKDVPADLLRAVKAVLSPTKGSTITALRDGKVESWRVSPELADAVNYTNRDSVNFIMKALGGFARFSRAGAVFSPDFIAKSPMRDIFSMAINSKDMLIHPLETLNSILSIAKQDKVYQDWMRAGGANSSVVALDRRYIQENLLKLDQETGLMSRAWNIATSPAQKTMLGLRAASEFTDTMMRLPEFKRRMAEGATPAEAAFAAREVTVDFARMGSKMQALNTLIPFLNAGIQGLDRTIREAKERPGSFAAKGAMYITAPTVALFLVNASDPQYWEIPQWQRDMFWIVPVGDTYWRIPKPFELGLIFGTLPERILTDFMMERPEAWREFHKTALQAFNPLGWPSFIGPVVEQMSNKGFGGGPIVPKQAENLLPEYQYNNYTTETAKALGRLLGTFPGMESAAVNDETFLGGAAKALTSPVLIENYVKGWTSGLGMYALQIADYGLRKAGVVPDPVKPASTLADIPFIKSFVVRYPSANTDSIVRFYERYHDTKVRYDSWMNRAKEGDLESMARIQAAGGDRIFVTLDAFKDTLTEQQKLVNMLFKNPDFSKEEKRQLIDTLYYQMISVARTGNEAFREMNHSLKR